MNPTTIKCHITVEGGRLLSSTNAHRIVARHTVATDRMGNRLPTPIYELKNDPPYFQSWRVVRHPKKGYAFVEVRNGSGLGGFQPTVRRLVVSALCCGLFGARTDLKVEILPEGCPEPAPLVQRHPPYKDWHDGADWCKGPGKHPAQIAA